MTWGIDNWMRSCSTIQMSYRSIYNNIHPSRSSESKSLVNRPPLNTILSNIMARSSLDRAANNIEESKRNLRQMGKGEEQKSATTMDKIAQTLQQKK